MKIVLASGNQHKHEEFSRIFTGHELFLPKDLGCEFEHDETGSTYMENSLGKALTLFRLLRDRDLKGYAVIADDSGISVPALGGAPGVYSARYGQKERGRQLSDKERNSFLLSNMEGKNDRTAFFVCAMVLLLDEYRYFTAQEILPGVLAESPKGQGGFGYDPLLYITHLGKTVAELFPEEKDRLSHRGLAGRALRTIVEHHIERKTL